MSSRLSGNFVSTINNKLLRQRALEVFIPCALRGHDVVNVATQPTVLFRRHASTQQPHSPVVWSNSSFCSSKPQFSAVLGCVSANRRSVSTVPSSNVPIATKQSLVAARSSSSTASNSPSADGVTVQFDGELAVIELRIPGTSEKRRFVFRRHVDRLSDLFDAIRAECSDGGRAGAYQIQVLTADGVRLANSTVLGVAFGPQSEALRIAISSGDSEQNVGEVAVLLDASTTGVATERVQQLQSTINSLFEQYNVGALRQAKREACERELVELRKQIAPLETQRQELERKAKRSGVRFSWFGMAYMGVQMGVLARLTWWEYSWDIVEPISYFVTYATGMVFFAYYLLTRQEWSFPAVEDRRVLFKLHKFADRSGFDTQLYNKLKQRISQLEEELRSLDSASASASGPALLTSS